MNKTHRIKVLGLLSLPLLVVALAVMVFAWGSSTDTAEASTDGAAMSMTISPTQTCPGAKAPGDICVAENTSFTVTVSADAIPLTNGYVGVQAYIQYGATGLTYKGATVSWPDIEGATFLCNDTGTGIGCGGLSGLIPPQPISVHKGDLFVFTFNCDKSQGHVLDLQTMGGPNAGTSGNAYAEVGVGNIAATGEIITLNCTVGNTPTPTPTDTPTPTPTPTNTPPPIPQMQKLPLLQNVFLTSQGSKIPPASCLAGTNVGGLSEVLSQEIVSPDPKSETPAFQVLAAFEFEVHYDATQVCVDLTEGSTWSAAGAVCIIEDSASKPSLEGVARIGCVTWGKDGLIDQASALAQVDVRPQPDVYSQAKPNQENGVVVQINNVDCDLSDEQGEAIPIFSCDDADITFRYLEGDVIPDCAINAADAQAIAFRWGAEVGNLIYKDFMNLEPSGTQSDRDIDINDLQFVYGRFGSSCADPHPPQDPVNPKAS